MHLENLKIEINQNFSSEFIMCFPKKNYNKNRIFIYSIHDITLLPNERKIIPLELKFAVDKNYLLQINSNEVIAMQNGIQTLQQSIMHNDNDFINITMWNTTNVKYNISKGDIIAYSYIIASPVLYDLQKVKKI